MRQIITTRPCADGLLYNGLEHPQPLDFAIIRLAGAPSHPGEGDTFHPVTLSTQRPGRGDRVRIIQHPMGNRKVYAEGKLQVDSFRDCQLFYWTSTIKGSSGAPVFNTQYEVVAVHCGSAIPDGVRARTPEVKQEYPNGGLLSDCVLERLRRDAPALLREIQEAREDQPG